MLTLKIFCKAPVPGEVNTRLIPALGPASATKLHEAMAQRVVNLCLTPQITKHANVELWCSPTVEHEFYDQFNGRFNRHLQIGDDLGQRMANAFDATRYPAILTGTDCANLDSAYLLQAIAQLANHDAVIGPAEDGGYGLIGLRHPMPQVFQDMPWGTETVCAQTCRVLNHQTRNDLQINWALLPLLWDVDRMEDVERYRRLELV